MNSVATLLLGYAVIVVVSLVVTGMHHPVRGTGGHLEPPLREKPSADEPTPVRSVTASRGEAARAQRKTPPA